MWNIIVILIALILESTHVTELKVVILQKVVHFWNATLPSSAIWLSKRLFLRVGSPHKKICESVSWRREGREHPFFYQVFLQGQQITIVSLCPRMWSRNWRLQETKCKIQKRGLCAQVQNCHCQPDPLTATYPWRHQNPKWHPRSSPACTQTCLRLSRELPTSYMLHCVTFYILLCETTSYRLTQPGRLSKCSRVCFLRHGWGKH